MFVRSYGHISIPIYSLYASVQTDVIVIFKAQNRVHGSPFFYEWSIFDSMLLEVLSTQ